MRAHLSRREICKRDRPTVAYACEGPRRRSMALYAIAIVAFCLGGVSFVLLTFDGGASTERQGQF